MSRAKVTQALRVSIGALFLIALATSASAVTISFEVLGGGGAVDMTANGTITSSGLVDTWELNTTPTVDGVLVNDWTAILKEDPYVNNNINVTNTTNATQTIIASVILPIPAYFYNAVINSSIGVTITDSDGQNDMSFAQNGATPIYQGQVNGGTELSLNPPDLPLTTADCQVVFDGCSATRSTGTAFQAAGPGVANQIAIVLTFDLSPQDSVGITSRFEIVPEPGTALLMGTGLFGLAIAGRRRA